MSTVDSDGQFDERRARAALTALVEPGDLRVWLAARNVGAVQVVEQLRRSRKLDTSLPADPLGQADRLLEQAARIGARFVIPGDDEWPETGLHGLLLLAVRRQEAREQGQQLPTIERSVAPPLGLWLRGPLPLAETVRRAVALVGSRAATGYGTHVAAELAYGLVDHGWTVISGGDCVLS